MAIQKNVFWEALILAIFVFASGILLGYLLEQNRTDKIITSYQEAELNLLDIRIQENIFLSGEFNCEDAIEETIAFADRTYNEALVLEKYADSAKLSEGIVFQHMKYDLLRTILWLNTIKIKNTCPESFHTIVYFYEYDPDDVSLISEQKTFSKYLSELKQEYANEIILIPIAGNLEINSINMLKSNYGIDSLPVILIDEQTKVSELDELETMRDYLD